jgi:menaquinone-dependent protoporphyrinogen oxidase
LLNEEKEGTIMENTVLIAYGSKYGATAGIAEKIGEVLRREGFTVEVRQARSVSDVSAYRAVVIGSGLYIGQWLKEAAKLLQDQEQALSQRPVWFFVTGPTGGGSGPPALPQKFRNSDRLKPVTDRIQPRDIALFGGMIDPKKISFIDKIVVKAVKAQVGDFRDWSAIETWVKVIADTLKQ